MQIEHLDHLVLTVANIEAAAAFYARAMGMEVVTFGAGRTALIFGQQKINLHERGKEFEPKAASPTPGSADLCFITTMPMSAVVEHLNAQGISMLQAPAERTGAIGKLLSVYFRDPDGNLIEVSNTL